MMSASSPKRKRTESKHGATDTTNSLLTKFPPLQPDTDDEGEDSPRARVAGGFQRLSISQSDSPFRNNEQDLHRPSKRQHLQDEVPETPEEPEDPLQAHDQQMDGPAELQFSPPPSTPPSALGRAMSTVYSNGEAARPKSPCLKGDINDHYWQDSEITGHLGIDPDDDGYGINGVGFKPTSAMAYARTQKRKQQIAEYRNREAKEARARRSEKRRVASNELRGPSPLPAMPETPSKSRVRFRDVS